ncbi:chloride channel protein, partial [Escherichia coli]
MLITEGLCVGLVGGFVVLLYRVALTFAGDWLVKILSYMKGNPFRCVVWFLILAALAWIVGKLVKWEPMISGSGIPQVEGEIAGRLSQNWKRVLPAKFAGGFLCMLGGLSLGREGPSI